MKQELHDKAKPAEPKFKYSIGQKVKSIYTDEVLTIKEHCGRLSNDNVYRVEEYEYTWNECELRPYTDVEGEEAKPAEPKFKVGDKVKIIGGNPDYIGINAEVVSVSNKIAVIKFPNGNYSTYVTSSLKPYTEPEDGSNHSEKLNISDKQLERRLNIAKDFAAVLLGRLDYNPFMAHINCCSDGKPVNPYRHMASIAMSVADALIAEAEKGGEK